MPPPPDLNIPASISTVHVRIIDTTSYIGLPIARYFTPAIEGHTHLKCPSFSFLIEHPILKRSLLFDLGIRKDWKNLPPYIVKHLAIFDVKVEKDVREILEEGGLDVRNVEAIVWSHWHWDHTGDPSKFSPKTKVIVGPGFKKRFVPDLLYSSENINGIVAASAFEGRELVVCLPGNGNFYSLYTSTVAILTPAQELEFSGALKIGNFKAMDYFGDGSFYLLDSPGHTTGNMTALARVTPTSFIFMGGDTCHHNGEFRPSPYLPLPDQIHPHPFSASSPTPCPGSMFQSLLRDGDRTKPFYYLKVDEQGEANMAEDVEEAVKTIRKVMEVDSQQQVLVVMAHDDSLVGIVDFFPEYADSFAEKGWVAKSTWAFLNDFIGAVKKS